MTGGVVAPVASKKCTRCLQVKPHAHFHNQADSSTKRARWCKACACEVAKANYQRRKHRWDYLDGK